MARISAYTALPSADGGDTLPILDVSATTTKKITKTAFLSDIIDGSLLATQAVKANKADFSVADQTARDVFTPFDGLMVYRKDLECIEVYDGSAWRTFGDFEILKKITLGSNATTLSTGTFAARKYLRFFINTIPSGSLNWGYRFNNDSANNYAANSSVNFGASVLTPSNANLFCGVVGALTSFVVGDVYNVASRSKQVRSITNDDGGNNLASTVGNIYDVGGKWINTSNQITRLDLFTTTNNFAAGTEIIVLGRDFA